MIVNQLMLRWQDEATQADKDRALRDVMGLEGRFRGCWRYGAGVNFSERARGHGFGTAMMFESRAALEAYRTHPLHMELLEWLVPLVEAMDLDFEV